MNRILLLAVLLAGCANAPVPTGPDSYMLSAKSLALGASVGDAKANAFRDANDFCAKQGKSLVIQSGQDHPGGFGRPPEAEVNFMCLDKGDRDLRRPNLTPTPNAVIEVKK